jgi:hypothetical protein
MRRALALTNSTILSAYGESSARRRRSTCGPAVRRWSTGRKVTGCDCRFAEFQSTGSDRYESEKGKSIGPCTNMVSNRLIEIPGNRPVLSLHPDAGLFVSSDKIIFLQASLTSHSYEVLVPCCCQNDTTRLIGHSFLLSGFSSLFFFGGVGLGAVCSCLQTTWETHQLACHIP